MFLQRGRVYGWVWPMQRYSGGFSVAALALLSCQHLFFRLGHARRHVPSPACSLSSWPLRH